MRIVGTRKSQAITFNASADLLRAGAHFNDEIHKLPTGTITGIPKGAYLFKTHADANKHADDCLINAMVQIAHKRAQKTMREKDVVEEWRLLKRN